MDAFFERITRINEPTKAVDSTWVESFGFETGHPSAIPSMLKWLKVIDEHGISTGVWKKLRVPATKEETLGELVRLAYAPIFESVDMESATTEDIGGAFLSAYSIGDARRHIICFLALCRHAGIETAAGAQQSEPRESRPRQAKTTAQKAVTERKPAERKAERTRHEGKAERDRPPTTPMAAVSVNVELPADWDDEKVQARLAAVAKALRDNGLA